MVSLIVVKYVYNIESDNMNRKTKIIVSITGITLVGLMLLGLTYGYFITKINGNTNAKSISVSSAKKVVEYTDLSEEISGKIIEPGYETIKVFTAKNIGDTSATYHIYLDNVVNDFIRIQDITYTLYRKAGNNTIDTSNLSDSDIVATGILPRDSNYILLNQTIETPNDYYTYALKINYINSEENQDEDQGHTFSFKVQLLGDIVNNFAEDTLAYNILDNSMKKTNGTEFVMTPKTKVAEEVSSYKYYTDRVDEASTESNMTVSTTYQGYYWTYGTGYTINESTGKFTLTGVSTCKYNDGTCNSTLVGKYLVSAYASGNSSSTDTQKTITNLSNIYKVTVAPSSSSSNITMKYKKIFPVTNSLEKELSVAMDDYGVSYYYRGGVEDNYVDFAGMCWRIVRVLGGGHVKLVLEDQDSECKNSDGNWDIPTTTGGTIKNGNFGYTRHAAKTLTASDGTTNSYLMYIRNYLNGGVNNDKSMATAFKNFQTLLGNRLSLSDQLRIGYWCLNDKVYYNDNVNFNSLNAQQVLDKKIKGNDVYYDSYIRLYKSNIKNPVLKCNGTFIDKFGDNTNIFVGTLTADEIVYAGSTTRLTNSSNYLVNNYSKNNSLSFWSLSPSSFVYTSGLEEGYFDAVYRLNYNGIVIGDIVSSTIKFRPAIVLDYKNKFEGGNGTKANAYKIQYGE